MENDGTIQKFVGAASCLAIFVVFTAYVFLNAQLKDTYGDLVFLVLLFLAIPRLARVRLPGYRAALVALFWSYLALTLASVLFPPSTNANVTWLVAAQYRIIFSALIVLSLLNLSETDRIVLRWGMAATCLLLSVLYILQQNGFEVQKNLGFLSPLKTDLSKWHDKNFAIWQLLLMWGSIGFLWCRKISCRIAAVPVAALALVAIFLSTSESSQLAAIISIIVFAASHLRWLRRQYLLCVTAAMSAIWVPILWLCFTPVKPLFESYLPKISSITVRLELFDYTAALIRKELVIGYGFSSTLYRTIPKGEVGWWTVFPGGHTHNLPFQLFMDHGLLGMIFIATILAMLIHYIYKATVETSHAPAVWALLAAGLILFSLSYATWMADMVLMYCMWLGLIFSTSSRHDLRVAHWLENPWLVRAIMLFGMTAIACYGVDYHFLAGR
jgi:O-antigen ligase